MSNPPSPRRRDAIEKSAAIARAATTLVLDHGYEAVTVDMICELAGVSQRTFFNHFATKDAALLGAAPPTIDEAAARAFVTSTAPLLAEAAQLIHLDVGDLVDDPKELARRIRAIGSSPLLMARQMEHIESLAAELREIILRRLRTQFPDEADADLQAQAGLITHLVAGLMRHTGQSWAEQAAAGRRPDVDRDAITALLSRTLSKLG